MHVSPTGNCDSVASRTIPAVHSPRSSKRTTRRRGGHCGTPTSPPSVSPTVWLLLGRTAAQVGAFDALLLQRVMLGERTAGAEARGGGHHPCGLPCIPSGGRGGGGGGAGRSVALRRCCCQAIDGGHYRCAQSPPVGHRGGRCRAARPARTRPKRGGMGGGGGGLPLLSPHTPVLIAGQARPYGHVWAPTLRSVAALPSPLHGSGAAVLLPRQRRPHPRPRCPGLPPALPLFFPRAGRYARGL